MAGPVRSIANFVEVRSHRLLPFFMVALGVATGFAQDIEGPGREPEAAHLSNEEVLAIMRSFESCWVPPDSKPEKWQQPVTVEVRLTKEGGLKSMPRLLEPEVLGDTETSRLYASAVSAIVKCTAQGLPLPPEKYPSWKVIEIVFRANGYLGF